MKVFAKSQVVQFIQEHKDFILEKGVRKIGLFGSFVTGLQTETSDLDFLVDFDPEKKSFQSFMDLAFFLEDHLERKVDLLTCEGLSPHLAPQIYQEVEFIGL